jgi:hypothetical protein
VSDFPLTPGEAIVLATFLEEHAKLPHLVALVDRLRTWARTQTAATEEGEMPSQDESYGHERSTISTSNRTAPGERVNAQTEGLTTDYVGV